ncbi:MAG: transcriptional regulator [Lachnospiraceae bacterium]
MPDIMLLAPIARLLDISLDTLLSFQGELTDKEANDLVKTASDRLETENYHEVFQWAKKQMELYPNCECLILWMTAVLDANRMFKDIPDAEQYDDFIKTSYERLLSSSAEQIKTTAADSLYGFYMRKEQYDEAEKYLKYFSLQNPERKRKQAALCEKAGRMEEAYQTYEELLFSGYQMLNMVVNSMLIMRLKENNIEKAEYLVGKLKQMAGLFEMGEYHEHASELEFMTVKKDVEGTLNCVRHMLSSVKDIVAYCRAPLYEHMTFKEPSDEFGEGLRKNLVACFQEEEGFGYMKDDERWKQLMENQVIS